MLCLVVDDDSTIRTFVCAIAHAEGLETLEAPCGDDAFDALRMLDGAVGLLVTDIQMPHGDGLSLARRVAARFPHVRAILMSGYVEPEGGFEFVAKPFSWITMRDALRRVLSRPPRAVVTP